MRNKVERSEGKRNRAVERSAKPCVSNATTSNNTFLQLSPPTPSGSYNQPNSLLLLYSDETGASHKTVTEIRGTPLLMLLVPMIHNMILPSGQRGTEDICVPSNISNHSR
jgi:hypothetical protein